MNTTTYNAPWGKTLLWVSILATAVLLGVVVALVVKPVPEPGRWLVILPILILPGTALFIIRSYTIEPNALAIQRLFWTTRLPLSGLQSATVEPNAMRWSIRLCGNGGLFSITGWYRNRALGNYRAFVTDLTQTVVLRFPKKTIVVSPENPEQFVSEISQFAFRTA
jgi:hypothetical protein